MNLFSYLRLLFPMLLFFSQISNASFSVSPTSGQIYVSKKTNNPNTSFYVENNESESIAIDTFLRVRKYHEDGTFLEEQPKNLSERIDIFPKQFFLKPKEKRLVKIIYKGPKDIKTEENYRIIIQRLAVELSKNSSKTKKNANAIVNFVVQFHGNVMVTPIEGKPNVKLIKYEKRHFVSKDKKEETDGISLTFENTGTASFMLENYEASVNYIDEYGKEKNKILKQKDVFPKTALYTESRGRVFVKSSKTVFLPFAEKFTKIKNIEVTFE